MRRVLVAAGAALGLWAAIAVAAGALGNLLEWLAELVAPRPRFAQDVDTGELYGFRVSPLTVPEAAAAAARERAAHGLDPMTIGE